MLNYKEVSELREHDSSATLNKFQNVVPANVLITLKVTFLNDWLANEYLKVASQENVF